MNKKLFLGMFAAAGMLFATSCSNDELDVVQSGNEAQVTFNLGTEGGLTTRAISDGTGADKLVYAVYKLDAQGNPELQKVVGSNENGQFVKTDFKSGDNVTITLAKGQTYQVAFWAQDGDCDAYNTNDLAAVEVEYTTENGGAVNNDELRDAFFKTVEFEVAGNKTIDVVLKRPFAQVNVGVTAEDWEAAVASGIKVENSAVVIKNAANQINLLTGAVTGNETVVTYASNTIPEETLYVETDATKEGKEAYKWLSMSYILVADESADGASKATLQSLQYTFTPENGNAIVFKEGLNTVPVQRNWRTNILGKILTGDIQFNITIDPVYDGDYIYPDGAAQELEFAATFGGTVTLTENVTLTQPLVVTADMVVNLNGFTLKGGKEYVAGLSGVDIAAVTVDNKASLTIEGEGAIEGTAYGVYVKDGAATVKGGDIKAGTSAIQVNYGTANIEGGNFSSTTEDKKYVVNCIDARWKDGSAKVSITGGTFEQFDPANNRAEGKGTNFVTEGCKSVQVGDNYVVVANETALVSTSEDLKNAFAAGGKVILASDIELDDQLKVSNGANVLFDMNGKKITVDNESTADPVFYTYQGTTLTITGNGTVELENPYTSLMFPAGDVVIENGTFTRNVPEGTPAKQVGAFFVGAKVSGSQTVTINGGYFDGGYYDKNAADIDDILAGTKTFIETEDDVNKRGNSKDANIVRVAVKNNMQLLLNLSSNLFKIYGGTFVGANPAWGDEGCMLPTSPNYLRPWSYYQGAMLDGQEFNENGLVLPEGYTITKGVTEDGVPTYTVAYNK